MGAGVKYSKLLVLIFLLVIFSSSVFGTVFSIEINFTNNGTQNYIVTGTNINPEVKIGDLDPNIPLFKGDKIVINNAVHETEPFKIISKNSEGALKELLVQGSTVGTLEAVAEIDWKDNTTTGKISFNVTEGLINNLTNNSNNFGIYMSDNNTAMNGTFNIESDQGFSYCYQFDGDEERCIGDNASDVCFWTEGEWGGLCDPYDCYSFTSNLTCSLSESLGFPCSWNTAYNYCEEVGCWNFDGSNANACENNTIGKSCEWDASSSSCYDSWQGCSSFNSMMQCFDTGWCMWNGTGCTDPDFGGEETGFGGGDTGCFMFGQESFCNNVTGCVWSGGSCGGNTSGITCESINQTDYCNSVPFMDTCCAWTTGGCNATFSTGCWDNIQTPPAGAMYCEDYSAINNETVCNNISGTPWYMPCAWDNVSGACGFNTDDYFTEGDAYFEDIGSSSTCTAAGGVWQTETFISADGNYLTDEWCEMGFGVQYESCDSSCWACEFKEDGSSWGVWPTATSAAESACEGSVLGYCQFTPDEYAFNGLGWCDIPFELQTSGCGIETNCEDYNYYSNDSSECNIDADCKWMTDPANSNIGWCAGANAKSCDQDCGECNDQAECTTYGGGGSSACEWDSQAYYCKNVLGQGESASETCFNGIDDDNDGMIDCIDSDCMSDLFCGGSGGINCGTYSESNTSCFTQEGCTWVTDHYSDNTSDGWCDITGSDCWVYDDDEASCGDNETNGALGCVWMTSLMGQTFGICDVNFTAYAPCFAYDSNYSGCQTVNATCSWESTDGSNTNDNGWCNPKPFGCWSNYFSNSSGCIADSDCTWTNDSFSPQGGWCDPTCFSLNTTACNADSTCESKSGFCEPAAFASGGCWANDGNKTACDLKSQCSYFTDAFANNNLSVTEPGGWCNDAFMMHHFEGMEDGMPTIIADDPQGCSLFTLEWNETMPASVDICGVGVKEMDAAYGFGVTMGSLENASFCNGKNVINPTMFGGGGGSPGVGNDTVSIYLYLDTDGTTTGSCNSGNGTAGFEFKFTYEALMTSGNLSESKLSYKCNNGEWGTTGIGISLWPEKSCSEMGAVILAIDRESLEAEDGFNKTVSMRALVASSNTTGNEATVLDSAEGYYMQGSFDFIAEDCYGMVDLDGDGCLPSEDPDCMMFNKFGFIPFEDCYNNIDDNNDGLTDCNDPMCKYDIYACGGTLEVDLNDNEPPQLAFLEVNPMPDGAFIMLDTFEPSNANVSFYHNDSTCTTLNSSIDEPGALAYKPWHDVPIDNYAFNSRAIGFDLAGNKTYYFKYKLCDISENCIVSACSNFTTQVNYAACGIKCKTFIGDLDFKPPTTNVSQPLGNLQIQYDLGSDGDYDYNKTYGDASSQETLNNTGLVSIKIQNPNSTIDWGIECINGTVPKSVSFNSSQIDINESAGNGMIGMPTSEFKNKFQSDFNCQKIHITLPYNGSSIWHCLNDSTSSCTNVTNSSTLITTSANSSTWQVDPSEVGFSFFLSDDTNPAPASTTTGGDDTGGDDTTITDDTTPPPTTNTTCDNDGVCETGETSDNCSADCPVASDNATVDVCNNDGACDDGETSDNCSADCPVASDNDTVDVCNNDGVCDDGENSDNCAADCPAISDNDTGTSSLTADDENDLPILVGVAVVAILGILAVIYLSRGKGSKGNDEEDLL